MVPRRSESTGTHHVSSLLHTLRGEEFRRRRNLLGAHAHVPASSFPHGRSLPALFSSESDYGDSLHELPTPPLRGTKVAGPAAPRSWTPPAPHTTPSATPEWRLRALSLILSRLPPQSPALAPGINPRVPSLFQLCLHHLLSEWGGIPSGMFPHLPRHILREYVRYSAVHAPDLPREDLMALWSVEDAGSADGELIIYGPAADSLLPRAAASSTTHVSEWDSPAAAEPEPPPVLHTLVVLSSAFSPSLVASFPPTLTHLALLRVPPIPLHKLPLQLPLITILDLSFNPWVGTGAGRIVHVDWSKWRDLEVLGVRDCGVNDEDATALRKKVNRGRLTDVEIVFDG